MYKAGYSAVSRTVLTSSVPNKKGGKQVVNYSQQWQTAQEKERYAETKTEPLLKTEYAISMFSKKKSNVPAMTPPSTPSTPLEENQIEFLHNSWKSFYYNANGEPDEKIVVYKPDKQESDDFVPFDIDRYLAERLLKELEIDPKLVL